MKAIKIYFSESDLEDMQKSFHKEENQLWNTWECKDETKQTIKVEMYLGDEPDDKPDEPTRFLVWKYNDGSTISQQHYEPFDGKWKYPENVYEVTFTVDAPNPLLEQD